MRESSDDAATHVYGCSDRGLEAGAVEGSLEGCISCLTDPLGALLGLPFALDLQSVDRGDELLRQI